MPNATSFLYERSRKEGIVAVLAAYNLQNEIAQIVERTKKFVDLVIVVADASKDNTDEAARKAGAIVPKKMMIRGKSHAVRRGIKCSRSFNPSVVVLMDADGQHLPEEIPKIIAPLLTNAVDMVVGSRMKGTLRTSPINKLGNSVLKLITYLVTGRWLTDTESGFRGFRAERIYQLNLKSKYYEIEGELLLRALNKGFRIKEVPITVPKAVPGVTVRDGLRMGAYKIKLAFELKFGSEKNV